MRTTCCGEITENRKRRLQTLHVCSRLFPKGGTYTPMIRKIDHNRMGRSERGWLTCWFHFPFAEYAGPDTPPFGCLQVLNDELIQPGFGFDTHFHRDMEILTYVAGGGLTHADSLKNHRVLGRGELQYISAGTGLFHSERNEGRSLLRLLQIGIPPDKPGYPPRYDAVCFPWGARENRWLSLVSGTQGKAPITIRQDVSLYAAAITGGKSLEFHVFPGRQAYLVVIEGEAELGGVSLSARDAAEIGPDLVRITAKSAAHLLRFDMSGA